MQKILKTFKCKIFKLTKYENFSISLPQCLEGNLQTYVKITFIIGEISIDIAMYWFALKAKIIPEKTDYFIMTS